MSDLIAAAHKARESAYVPYSGYKVGAALRDAGGAIWTGCNVENVSYPLSVCAERNAVAAMVRGGSLEITEVAVVTMDGGTPCGGCLQVLLEFSPNPALVSVVCATVAGESKSYSLSELIPHGFRSAAVPRT